MTGRSKLGIVLTATGSFIGGMALGLLLSPRSGRENRKWLTHSATELADWADEKGRDVLGEGEKQLERIRSTMNRGIKNNVPDLYEATERIDLDDDGLMDG